MNKFAFAPCGGLRYPLLVLPTAFGEIVGKILFWVSYLGVLGDDHSSVGGSVDTNAGLIVYLWGRSSLSLLGWYLYFHWDLFVDTFTLHLIIVATM